MGADLILVPSTSSRAACQDRVAKAASGHSNEILGYALSSQVDVFDGGDCFELRHKLEPVVFSGSISNSSTNAGSLISGQIRVPGQNLHRFLVAFACIVTVWGLGNSAWDLLFGTHLLLTRSRTELGPGHPASMEEHLAVFLFLPLVAIPIVTMLWPKARGASNDARQTLKDCLQKMFGNQV